MNSYDLQSYILMVLFDHHFNPHVLLQGMESVAVETVNAGKDGMEMHVKSGLALNILNDSMGDNWIFISRPF